MNDEFNHKFDNDGEQLHIPDEDNMKSIPNPYQSVRVGEDVAPIEPEPVKPTQVKEADTAVQKESSTLAESIIADIENNHNLTETDNKIGQPEEKTIETPVAVATVQPATKQRSKLSRAINKTIMVIAIIVCVVSATVIVKHYVDIAKSKKEANELAVLVGGDSVDINAVGADGILERYREAYNTNNDLVGWIKVPNTSIDHPVVKSSDNEYYLRKNFYKVYDRRGAIFMDYQDHIDTFCKNTILYGHNNLDSTMFSDLEKYKDIEFYRTAPVIEFNTIYRNYKWKVFAVFLTNAEDGDDNGYTFNYIYPFMTDKNFDDYTSELAIRSLYFTGVDVKKTDKILTLSTCTRDMDVKGNGQTDARCVIVARLVRDGESATVDTSLAIKNDCPRYPQVWYTAHGQTNPYAEANRWYPEGVAY